SGLELGVAPMPDGQVVSVELRMLTGTTDEPADRLGLARLVRETIDKGTAQRDGRALLDAFDELGASLGSWVGREATGYSFLCLPEFVGQAVALHAEFLRSPTFPAEAVEAALALTFQELAALDDDPPSLADKLIGLQGFGPVVGRYPLGERETLERIGRDDIEAHWRSHYSAGRLQVSVAGPVEPPAMADLFERHFAGFGNGDHGGRDLLGYKFQPARSHHARQIEQEQIALCFPSAAVTDDDFAAERVLLGVLSGGMSARLFTEVREKLGLAYDVHAGHENPRGLGMIFVSASCKPERAQTTFETLLREIDRLSEDLTDEEVDRAKTRIIAREETLADMTRSRRGSLAFDLFHHGRPVPIDQRLERIRSVTADDLTRYLQTHPRDRLSIVTLGPEEIGPG
ncbi:MAG: insulinase family protein, partial [Planctomycetes bacterium]|nr:insulinase family protein [Planctomycetota bacterium]